MTSDVANDFRRDQTNNVCLMFVSRYAVRTVSCENTMGTSVVAVSLVLLFALFGKMDKCLQCYVVPLWPISLNKQIRTQAF